MRSLIIFLVLVLIGTGSALAQPTDQLVYDGDIIYVSNESGNYDIWTLNPVTLEKSNITQSPEDEFNPQLSEDRTLMIYAKYDSSNGGSANVWIRDISQADSVPEQLTFGDSDWDPNFCQVEGSDLVVYKAGNDIYVIRTDKTFVINLTADLFGEAWDPIYNPDCTKVAFVLRSQGTPESDELYVINSDGTGLTPLTENEKTDWFPSWSADGNSLLFVCRDPDADAPESGDNLCTMDLTISEETVIVNEVTHLPFNQCDEADPEYSLDESQIIYVENCGSHWTMNIMNADGSDPHIILDEGYDILSPIYY